ncbi:MAG: hypothetical protein ACRYG7_50015 [Janthinobacterium lividum]
MMVISAAVSLALLGGWWWVAHPAPAPAGWAKPPLPAGPLVVSTLAGHPLPPTYADGPGSQASFRQLGALAIDRHGNVYVADQSTIRRISPAGVVSTLVGQPPRPQVQSDDQVLDFYEYSPSLDGRGAAARLSPGALAVAPDGAVYFTENSTVRRLNPQGEVTTVAGEPGNDGGGHRDGPARQARFRYPTGLAVAADGTVYVADAGNYVIRKISPAGVVSTVAGQPGSSGGVNGQGAAARFDNPTALALAADGALLVSDVGNYCIRRVTPQGEVTTWAGTLMNQRRGTNPGADLDLSGLQGFALAADGTLYFTGSDDRHTIRRLLPDRTETTYPWAGQKDARAYADAPTPGAARFNFPGSLAVGPDGTLYVADVQNQVVRAISPTGQVRTLAGQPPAASLDGRGLAATLSKPTGLALAADGSLLVAGGGRLRRISAQAEVTTLSGAEPDPGYSDSLPNFHPSQVSNPVGVAVVGSAIFISDASDNAVFRFEGPGKLTVWAGQPGIVPGDRDDGLLFKGQFRRPAALAAAPDGTLYVTHADGYAVRRITPKGRLGTFTSHSRPYISPFSNAARAGYPPYAIGMGPDGSVYVLQGALRRYPPGRRAQVLAGSDENGPGYQDGRGAAVRFNHPAGLCVAADGTVYVADTGNHLIRRVSPDGEVSTLAGQPGIHPLHLPGLDRLPQRYGPDQNLSGILQQLGDYHDGPAAAARFNHPTAVVLGPDDTLYVADRDNNCIRVVRPAKAAGQP